MSMSELSERLQVPLDVTWLTDGQFWQLCCEGGHMLWLYWVHDDDGNKMAWNHWDVEDMQSRKTMRVVQVCED